jgi:membrane protein
MRKAAGAVYRFFKEDETPYHASSLSFFTIFAITPTLLILLSVLTYVVGVEATVIQIKAFLFQLLIPTHQAVIEKYLTAFFDNSTTMGYMGLVYILVTSMMFFQNYEYIVNRIFDTKNRNLFHAFITFWLLTFISPLALFLSIYLSGEVQNALNWAGAGETIDTSVLLPFLIVWLLFAINYKLSPNKITRWKPTLTAAFAAAAVWYTGKNLFIYYIIHNTTYVTLYGSLSVMVIFFLWVYLSWMVFLYGLQLAKFLEERG